MLSFPSSKWTHAVAATNTSKRNTARSHVADLIIPRLYLSDYYVAKDSAELTRLGVTHVISVLEYDSEIPDCIPSSRKLQVRLADRGEEDLLIHFPKTTEFIASALAENDSNKVLVSINDSSHI